MFLVLFTKIIVATIGGVRTFRVIEFNRVCGVNKVPYDLVYFGSVHHFLLLYTPFTLNCCSRFSSAVPQTMIWGLTLYKHTIASRNGWGRTPVVSLMIRDGTTVFGLISSEQTYLYLVTSIVVVMIDRNKVLVIVSILYAIFLHTVAHVVSS